MGQEAKGKLHYFGKWADPQGALKEYKRFNVSKPIKKALKEDSGKPDTEQKKRASFERMASATCWTEDTEGNR